MMDRRRFTRLALTTLAGGLPLARAVAGDRYTREDDAQLTRQRADEAARSGTGPFGPLRFAGYRDLARLPWFELDAKGQLRLRPGDHVPVLDFHTHLGWSQMFAPQVDLLKRAPRTRYYMDLDATEPPAPLDLDVYINSNFTHAMHDALSKEVTHSLFGGSEVASTHTIPNLLDEMDALGVGRAAILPIAARLPFDDDPTLHILDGIEKAGAGDRLLPFASVHPRDPKRLKKLEAYARRGVRGIKLHPEIQRFFPDAPAAMEVYEACGRLDLPVIFHAGRSGIEPEFMRQYAMIKRYVPAVKAHPGVRFVFGHSGARDVLEAMEVARKHDNVWLEISSQGVSQLHAMMQSLGAGKLVFGTDWPFYPLGVGLAKVFLLTEGNLEARRAILAGNGEGVLRKAG